jgi:hypothetical protein
MQYLQLPIFYNFLNDIFGVLVSKLSLLWIVAKQNITHWGLPVYSCWVCYVSSSYRSVLTSGFLFLSKKQFEETFNSFSRQNWNNKKNIKIWNPDKTKVDLKGMSVLKKCETALPFHIADTVQKLNIWLCISLLARLFTKFVHMLITFQ